MGTLFVVQGAAAYIVRYRADPPARTVHRLPAPRTEDELALFLRLDLGLDLARVLHILTDVHRWGSTSIPFDLPADHADLFMPVDMPPP